MKKLFELLLLTTLTTGLWACSSSDAGPGEPLSGSTDQQVVPQPNPAPNTEYAPRPTASSRKPAPAAAPKETASKTPEATAETPRPANTRTDVADTPSPAAPRPERAMITVPEGTKLTVTLIDSLSTETSSEGDTFMASLSEPVVVDGKVVADKGTKVQGRVERVEEPGKVKGRATLELALTGIYDDSRMINLSTEPFAAISEDNKDRDAGIIAGGAGVGAVIGAIAGGKKGAAIGAIIGGGSGTTAVLVTRGAHIRLDSETKVNFVLDDSVRLPVIRNAT